MAERKLSALIALGLSEIYSKLVRHYIRVIILSVALLLLFQCVLTNSLSNYSVRVDSPTKENLCSFIVSLYRDFGEFGCCVESPIVEQDVCYTSTNLLAEYVLRNICGKSDLADRVKGFLNKYPTDFYDYYQILLLKPFTLPFTAIEHVQVDTLNGIRIVHVSRTNVVIEDYRNYANLLSLKALRDISHGYTNSAVEELTNLNAIFDGYGFADAYYKEHGKYEVYKIALAVILSKALNYTSEAEKYTEVLFKIKPFTTLYEPGFNGVGDLNLETASLSAMALYSAIHYDISLKTTSTIERRDYASSIAHTILYYVALIAMIFLISILIKTKTCSLRKCRIKTSNLAYSTKPLEELAELGSQK